MLNAIDSYFAYVTGRMVTINSNRKVIGITDAMDWPPKNIIFNAFYLMVLGEKPLMYKSFWSPTVPVIVHTLQWTWIISGSDLTNGVVGRSRGDRYRTNMMMREELLKATYPWFTQKNSYSVIGSTPSGIALESTPVSPVECVWWAPLTFLNRLDRGSGIVYGAATVQLTEMTQEILA